MAPSPFVGINPMMASNAVLTEIKRKYQSKLLIRGIGLFTLEKEKKTQAFTEEVQVGWMY